MSGKPSEQGLFWEWRAFGAIPDEVLGRVRERPVRGNPYTYNDDLYFVSDATEQNVKLRNGGGLLKIKPFYGRLDDGCELYEEAYRLAYALPVTPEAASFAAALLGLDLGADGPLSRDELVAAMDAPPVSVVRVEKRRTQYADGDGWIEIAEIEFPRATVASLGVQSTSLAETRRVRDAVDPDRLLHPMCYVGACRRWR